ncbi:DUF5688 family protein [Anaerovorax odorimutans]|uniref:DUF5688 family protein n=1 Tax=Anaerovorax odorimutans TaxID=109327 RepID=A0ABT1RKQ5_9FIRM|nr:DUF5688 family protein [Anaerovorax odorimutans]MCQ4635764.1 DUF5688 family protein [Anaerovorax odorimutans]
MMNYELFKKVIAERIKEFLPPGFMNYRVEISTVRKINQEKDTLIVRPENTGDIAAMPNIYLDEMYSLFQECEDLDRVLCKIAAMIIHYTARFSTEELDLDLSKRKDSIIMNLVNTQRNKELLKTVPHREVMDLSIIYRIIMGKQEQGMATVLVNNTIMEELGMDQEELDRLAYVNTGRMFPVEILKMSDMLYIMTNESKLHGATTMMYQEAVEVLADKIGGDFYLIPSSIHEVMAVPKEKGNLKSLIRLLEEGNRVCTQDFEILSNSIYQYDRSKGTFRLAASYYPQDERKGA